MNLEKKLEEAEKLIKPGSLEVDYDVEHELGRGRFAIVKRCVHKKTGKRYAAKVVKKSRSNTHGRSGREQLLMEISVLKRSTHPKMVRLYEVFETVGELTLILEYAEGGDLHRHCIETDIARTEKEICYLIRQILEATRYLHGEKIVHLDLKPDNILLAKKSEVFPEIRLIDFGLSRSLEGPYSQFDIVGTAEYVSPEVLAFDPIDYGSDMWSIGVVTYVLLSGISPFAGDDVMETYANIGCVEYDFDCEEFDEITDAAIDFIEKLLVRDPKKRMSAREALEHEWIKQMDGGVSTEDVLQAQQAKKELLPHDVEISPMQGDDGFAYSSESDTSNEVDIDLVTAMEDETSKGVKHRVTETSETRVEEKTKIEVVGKVNEKGNVNNKESKSSELSSKVEAEVIPSTGKKYAIKADEETSKIKDATKQVNGDISKKCYTPTSKELNGHATAASKEVNGDLPKRTGTPTSTEANHDLPKRAGTPPTSREVNNDASKGDSTPTSGSRPGTPTSGSRPGTPKSSISDKIGDKTKKFSMKQNGASVSPPPPLKHERFKMAPSKSFDTGFLTEKKKSEKKTLPSIKSSNLVKSSSINKSSEELDEKQEEPVESTAHAGSKEKKTENKNISIVMGNNFTKSSANKAPEGNVSPTPVKKQVESSETITDISKDNKTENQTFASAKNNKLDKCTVTKSLEEVPTPDSKLCTDESVESKPKSIHQNGSVRVESLGSTTDSNPAQPTEKLHKEADKTYNKKSPVPAPSKKSSDEPAKSAPPETKAKPGGITSKMTKFGKCEDSPGRQSSASKPTGKFDKKVNANESDELRSNLLFKMKRETVDIDSDDEKSATTMEPLTEQSGEEKSKLQINSKPKSPPPPVASKPKSPVSPTPRYDSPPVSPTPPPVSPTPRQDSLFQRQVVSSSSETTLTIGKISLSKSDTSIATVRAAPTTGGSATPPARHVSPAISPTPNEVSGKQDSKNRFGSPKVTRRDLPSKTTEFGIGITTVPKRESPVLRNAEDNPENGRASKSPPPPKAKPKVRPPEVASKPTKTKPSDVKNAPENGNVEDESLKPSEHEGDASNSECVVEPVTCITATAGGGLKFSLNIGGGSKKLNIGPLVSATNQGSKKMIKSLSLSGLDTDANQPQQISNSPLARDGNCRVIPESPDTTCETTQRAPRRFSLADTRGKNESVSRRRASNVGTGDDISHRKTYRRLYVTKVRNSKIYEHDFDIATEAAKIAQRVDKDVLQVEVKLKSTDLKLLP